MGRFHVAVFTESKERKEVEKLLKPYGEEYFDAYFREGHYCDVLEYRTNPNAQYDWYVNGFDFVAIGRFDDVSCAVLPTGEWVDLFGKSEERKIKRLKIKEMAIENGWFMAIVDCHC